MSDQFRLTSRGEAQARSGGMSPREMCLARLAALAEAEHQSFEAMCCRLANDLRGAAAADKRQRYYSDLAQTWQKLLAERGEA